MRRIAPFLLPIMAGSSLLLWSFVQRSSSHLTVDDKPSRYSGQISSRWIQKAVARRTCGPRFSLRFEIDDVFATAAEMGALIVRAQIAEDTVCFPLYVEPELGQKRVRLGYGSWGLVVWRGSASATHCLMERKDATSAEWRTVCDKCVARYRRPMD